MTRRSNIVGVEGGGGRARVETRTLLDYAGHYRLPEGGSAEAGSLEFVLDFIVVIRLLINETKPNKQTPFQEGMNH